MLYHRVFVRKLNQETGMKKIVGYFLIMAWSTIILMGWCVFPASATLCDGPPQSQSFILFSGGCVHSPQGLPCTQGFMFPAQSSAGGDFPTQYSLDFGDGSPPYYGQVDGVSHIYNSSGIFLLKFMAGTQCDLWSSGTFVMTIPSTANPSLDIPECVPAQPSAGFTGTPILGVAPLTVQFTGTSSGADAYTWNFGDGGTSPAQNPRHTYRTPGTYPVTLEVRDACSGRVDSIGKNNFVTVTSPATILSVDSNPHGADVFIDNVFRGRTPLTLTDTAIGNHRLTIMTDGYEEYTRDIILDAATPLTIGTSLIRISPQPTVRPPQNGSIAVTSIPSGAEVYIDDMRRAVAPAIIPEVLPGNHQVSLTFKGYDDWSTIVSVGTGQMSAINAELVATKVSTGSLAVITDPPGAEIFIEGDFKGVSPVTVPGLSAGNHTVLLTLENYADAMANISITAGHTQKFTTVMKKVYKPSTIDLVLAAGAFVMIAVIALVVMLRKGPKT
jgi:PKD repeat protein